MVDRLWQLKFTKLAQKDAQKLAVAGLKPKAQQLLKILQRNPFTSPPNYEKLKGDLRGAYSRRINLQHRLVYEVIDAEHTVKIIRMWSHYGE